MISGAGFVLLGVSNLRVSRESAFLKPAPSITPPPTTPTPAATEPILPPPPTATLLPTVLPISATAPPAASLPSQTSSPVLTCTPTVARSPTPPSPSSAAPSPSPTVFEKGLYTLRQRLGVGSGVLPVTPDAARRLDFGWYLDWNVSPDGFQSPDVEYVPMIRLRNLRPHPNNGALLAAVDALPGATWLIGNEPDVKWQDNVPPDLYAQAYHDLYTLLKTQDPTCQVAIGGVSQPTPLRLHYLDLVLEAYQARYGEPMPVDVWNVHNFILREERDSWGVDIPPGMAEQTGQLHEIADHDDMAIFRQQILDFRRWMKKNGQQDKPLIVSEYGILMPTDYGFPAETVEQFMLGTFEFFRTAADPELGYPSDGYRLVQRWCWFSLADTHYPTGNLLWIDSQEPTPLGEAFGQYAGPTP
jgi:hypothetical protein